MIRDAWIFYFYFIFLLRIGTTTHAVPCSDIRHTMIDGLGLGLEMKIDFKQPRKNGFLLTSLPTDAVLCLCGLLAVMGACCFSLPLFLDDGGVHSNSDAASWGSWKANGANSVPFLNSSSPFPVRIKITDFCFLKHLPLEGGSKVRENGLFIP